MPTVARRRTGTRRGISLMELAVVLTVMGILVATAVPSFRRAFEQSRADIAGANLRAIWSAERIYWLDNRVFTSDMQELADLGLLDSSLINGNVSYSFTISYADDSTFLAAATRVGSERWTGAFTIDQTGALSGSISAPSENNIYAGY